MPDPDDASRPGLTTVAEADDAGGTANGSVDPDAPERSDGEPVDADGDRSERRAVAAFLAVGGVAFVTFLGFGHRLWFNNDEWDFLAARKAGDIGDLFRPHGKVHPITLPLLVWRFLFTIFGLRSYVPYLVPLLLLHVAAAFLARAVMRKAGVRPWTATIAASVLVLFGAGYQGILWAFQITFAGTLVFGFAQLLLADHDGPIARRDALALLAGFLAMLCSGLAVTTVLVVGIATLLRRGWRAAAVQTVPLGLFYFVWWLTLARPHYDTSTAPPKSIIRFVVMTMWKTFQGLGDLPGVGALLVIVLVVGLALAYAADRRGLRGRLAAPIALLVGGVLFVANTAAGRSGGNPSSTERTRYLYVVAFLVMPAVAVAADAIARRRRSFAPMVLLVLVIGIPGNIKTLADDAHRDQKPQQQLRREILSLPRLPAAAERPDSLVPLVSGSDDYITISWLAAGARDGRIPDPGPISAAETAMGNLRISLTHFRVATPVPAAAGLRCVKPRAPTHLRLRAGEVFVVYQGEFRFTPVPNPVGIVLPFTVDADKKGRPARAVAPVDMRVATGSDKGRVCAPPDAYSQEP